MKDISLKVLFTILICSVPLFGCATQEELALQKWCATVSSVGSSQCEDLPTTIEKRKRAVGDHLKEQAALEERVYQEALRKKHDSPSKPRIETPKPPQRIDPNKIVNASSGSGFSVSSAGHVITNNHVIKGCKTVKIHTKGKPIPAKVIAYDSKNDIALLKGEFKPSTFFRFSIDNAQLLQEIYVAGYPFGRNVSSSVKVTKGIVSALIGIKDNTNQIQIDAALQPGNSGGPIIDAAGNVVGIAVSKLSIEKTFDNFGAIPENTNFGVKSDIAKLLLLKNNVNLITPNTKPIATAKLGHLISDSTYYLSCWMTVAQIQKMQSQKVLFNNLD